MKSGGDQSRRDGRAIPISFLPLKTLSLLSWHTLWVNFCTQAVKGKRENCMEALYKEMTGIRSIAAIG